jgi:hypothetical protein
MKAHGARPAGRSPRVGDRVYVHMGTHDAIGTVLEDRGLIGVNGRRLIRVAVRMDPDVEPLDFEVPAEETRLVIARTVARRRRGADARD